MINIAAAQETGIKNPVSGENAYKNYDNFDYGAGATVFQRFEYLKEKAIATEIFAIESGRFYEKAYQRLVHRSRELGQQLEFLMDEAKSMDEISGAIEVEISARLSEMEILFLLIEKELIAP